MSGFTRDLKKIYFRNLGYYPIEIDGLKFRCNPENIVFWSSVNRRAWEPETFTILANFLKPEFTYFDLGAWIGPTVLYAAQKCRKVFCFEPDLIAYECLLKNIRLNNIRNVVPFNLALSNHNGIFKMASFGGKFGDSTTSLLQGDAVDAMDAPCLSWNSIVDLFDIKRIDFMKMDIEGGEFTILPHMKDYLIENNTTLYLSTHQFLFDNDTASRKIEIIKDIISMYKKCYDGKMNEIKTNHLNSNEFLDNNHTFLLTN